MNNRPTTMELATLAASLPSGDHDERTQTALKIWYSCDKAVKGLVAWEKVDEKLRKTCESHDLSYWASLKLFLKQADPKSKDHGTRLKRYRDFLRADIAKSRKLEGQKLDDAVEAEILKRRERGFERIDMGSILPKLKKHLDLMKKQKMSERGKKGAAAKKALAAKNAKKNRRK